MVLRKDKNIMIHYKYHMRSQKGFSLIELLVSIALVAIIASMAMAMYEVYRTKTRDAVASVYLRNVVDVVANFRVNTPYVDVAQSACAISPPDYVGSPHCSTLLSNSGLTTQEGVVCDLTLPHLQGSGLMPEEFFSIG